MRSLILVALLILATAPVAAQTDEDLEQAGTKFCREMSLLAKDIMTLRQNDTPMSETLPAALGRLRELFVEEFEVDMEGLDQEGKEHFKEMERVVADTVMAAYDRPAYPGNESFKAELRREEISDFENGIFGACYKEMTSDTDVESDRLDARPAEIERQRLENERLRREAAASVDQAEIGADAETAYMFAIQQKINRNWVRPPTAKAGIECIVNVRQLPGGEVVSVNIGECNGDSTVRRSIEAAVHKASPLPAPSDPSAFDRNLRLEFRPSEQ